MIKNLGIFGVIFIVALISSDCRGRGDSMGLTPLSTSTPSSIPTSTSTKNIVVVVDSLGVKLSPSYFDGIQLLSQYYTLLDKGFSEEAVTFYSDQLSNKIKNDPLVFDAESVGIRFIYPYDYWLALQNSIPETIPESEMRFIVGLLVVHRSPALNKNGTPTPYSETYFIALINEKGGWKINEANSSPWP